MDIQNFKADYQFQGQLKGKAEIKSLKSPEGSILQFKMERPDFKAIFLNGAEGQVTYALNLTLYLKGKAEINSLKTPEGSILQFKMERSD